mgnify:CR=1 FL=1|jgi:hypothetical protein
MFHTHHCELFGEGLCGDGQVRALRQMLVGGGAIWITLVVIAPVPTAAFLFAVCPFMCHLLALADCDFTTFSDGCLGSINDEGRSEVR